MGCQGFRVVFVSPSCCYVSGYGSRELLVEMRGRAPVWSSIGRGWVVQPHTARDFIAVAESRGRTVEVSDEDPLPTVRGLLW